MQSSASEEMEEHKSKQATRNVIEVEYYLKEGCVLLSCEHIPLAVGSISSSTSEMFIQVVQL